MKKEREPQRIISRQAARSAGRENAGRQAPSDAWDGIGDQGVEDSG
jgi:hypothetical protein